MFNKPSFKFKKDDIFLSYAKANPKFKIHFYLNKVKINGGLDIDPSLYGTDVLSVLDNNHSGSSIKPSYQKNNDKKIHFFEDGKSYDDWGAIKEGTEYTGSYTILTSSITKELIWKNAGSASLFSGLTSQQTLEKLASLKNIYNYYRFLNPYFDFDTYIANLDGQETIFGYLPIPNYMSFIEIPRLYKGNKVKEGSLKLSFYYTGSLVAEAADLKKDGIIYETTGSNVGQVIGTVLYPEGLIVITASYSLNNSVFDGYLSPKTSKPTLGSGGWTWIENPKWVHFMSYQSYITKADSATSQSYAPASSSYAIEFQGETVVPTYTMFCHADKNDLVWSNNPTFIEKNDDFDGKTYEQIYVLSSGSNHYEERDEISIKNIVSSSFNNYSESYSPTTFISKIGVYDEDGDLIAVANLATPVKKTTKQDYTFKLKLDL